MKISFIVSGCREFSLFHVRKSDGLLRDLQGEFDSGMEVPHKVDSIHNILVKGLWPLFTDNASDRKDMESHLTDKLGSRRPGGINEKLFLFVCFRFTVLTFSLSLFFFFFFLLFLIHFGDTFYKLT